MAGSKPRVLVTGPEYLKAEDSFVSAAALECLRAPDSEGELASAVREMRAWSVIVGPRVYSGPLYEALPAGGVIARFGVGHDGIDKAKATAARLLCTNTPGVLNQSVAEHTLLLIGAAARKLTAMSTGVTRHVWEPAVGDELHGRTLAIIGCGGIGRAVARIASLGYGMKVVGCSRPNAPPPTALDHFRSVTNDFAAAVHDADFVSLHMSASLDNRHWLNRERLALIPERSWLINTSRGFVIDEAALFRALIERRLAGAALDVFMREPYTPVESGGDLRSLPNVVLTPHVGSNTTAANHRMAERAIRNVVLARDRAFAQMDLLNPEVLRPQ